MACSARGLSPRVRGNQAPADCAPSRAGSIPACAGEPGACRRAPSRAVGGTIDNRSAGTNVLGLSPRVRGNPYSIVIFCPGSIPACAGEPPSLRALQRRARVYPRVCGGTAWLVATGRFGRVYPRVCGGTDPLLRLESPDGSIPACAGEPAATGSIRFCNRVYPRVCGGTIGWDTPRSPSRGLSPRVRGNLHAAFVRRSGSGSIPACAGEPRRVDMHGVYPRVCGGTSSHRRVYPRVCGGTLQDQSESGLSPRVRGNRDWVYPRVCGGTCFCGIRSP